MNRTLFLACVPEARQDRRRIVRMPLFLAWMEVNPQPAPSKQRVLIEMQGKWDDYEPMSGPDYQPVVGE